MSCNCSSYCQCCRCNPGLFSRICEAISDMADDAHRSEMRRKNALADARILKHRTIEQYRGTRVVTVALRMYVNFWGGKNQKYFWHADISDQRQILSLAERELSSNPRAWGPLYWLVSILQRLCTPLVWLAKGFHQFMYFLDERRMLPTRWNNINAQMSRDKFIHKLERNWNLEPFRPVPYK